MKRALACLITAGASALAGCGGTSASGSVAPENAASLRADLAAIRAAASAHEPAAAHAATARMRADVQRLVSTGGLSAADGRMMLTALSQVNSRISAEVQAPASATVTVAPGASAPAQSPAKGPPPDHGHHGHGPKGGPGGGDGGD
jgi:hypothetical protein